MPKNTLKEIQNEPNDLQKQFENVSGFRREIDHALERIAAIECHLGITKKTTARPNHRPRRDRPGPGHSS